MNGSNGNRRIGSRRRASAAVTTIEALEQRLQLSAVDVSTFRYDAAGSGVNSSELQLTPSNVTVGSFGKLGVATLDGAVYAEPLVASAITIASGVNTTSGAAGDHNVVFVATENGSIYAIDTGSGTVLWKRSALSTTNSGGNIDNTLGATAIASVTDADTGLAASGELWDVTGTPVMDTATNLLYVVIRTKETIGGATHFVQRLHALNLADGTDAATPFLIGDTTGTYVNNTPIYAYGTGIGDTVDPYNNTGKMVVQFNARRELQRTALSLENNNVYVSWASNGDNGPYHGFVASWDVSHITTTGFALSGVLCTSPNDSEAGIWQSGGALAFEADGSTFFAMTGNGSGGAPTLGTDGLPVNANYNEAVIKVVADPGSTATHPNPNGWGMKIVDFFTPYNVEAMDNADSDFGAGAPLLLPPSAGITGHPNLLVAAGKDGRIFVLDRDDLGGYHATSDSALNSVLNSSGDTTAPAVIAGTLSTPTYFNGKLYAVGGYLGNAKAFTINSTGKLVASSTSKVNSFGSLPGGPTVSSDGASDGIVWMMDLNGEALRAFNASSLSTELWNSTQAAGGADTLGAGVKFAEPTVANGEVFVGTQNSLVMYGLTPPAGSSPDRPVLTATPLSASSINLTWTDSTVAPNLATGYLVEDSTDNSTFTQITTAPAGATSVAIGALTPSTTYYFRIRGFNIIGDSSFSAVAHATTSDGSTDPTNPVSPNAPTGLGASPASATSVYLTWTANSTNETGYHLDRASNSGFTQNLITQDLDITDSFYTDIQTGLAPGQTFYYRLRADNSAGDSGNSNVAIAIIPTVPPKPTDQAVTNVTTHEIDMSWQDNAGHLADGYRILRAVNNGAFTELVDLPPTSRTAPSEYDYSDTDVTPGNFYEYHIQAFNVAGNNDFAGVNATSVTDAPAGVIAVAGPRSVNLSWSAVTNAVSYNIYRGVTAGDESTTPLATGITATTFSDTTIAPGTSYYYEVTSVNGNATYTPPLPSESAPSLRVIPEVASATTLSVSANPISAGDLVTFTATVAPASLGATTPTGAVTFFDGATAISDAVTLNNGAAIFSTSTFVDATAHVISATYTGDTVYRASRSAPTTVNVQPAHSATLITSADWIGLGSSVTFTDTLAATTAQGPVPTGTVTFAEGATVLSVVNIATDGTAAFSTTSLPAGDQTLTAIYSGDTTYLPGTPATIGESVRDTPQSAALPVIGITNAPAAAVAGVPSHFNTPITIVNQSAVLKGLFVVNLYAAPGDSLLDAQLLGVRHRRATVAQGKSVKFSVGVKSFPATLPAGNYHLLVEVTDPLGHSSVTTTSQTVAVATPFIALDGAVSAVVPGILTAGRSGFVVVTLANTGNVIASGKLIVSLGATLDLNSLPVSQLGGIKETLRIGAGKSRTFRLHFKSTGVLLPGTYFPYVAATLDGVSKTFVGLTSFTIA